MSPLKLKPFKCTFVEEKVECLDFVLSTKAKEKKTEANKCFPRLVKQVKRSLNFFLYTYTSLLVTPSNNSLLP